MTMTEKAISRLALILALAAATAMPPAWADAASTQTFPSQAARYQARLSDLLDRDAPQFDAAFAQRFDALVAPYAKSHPRFRDRITSGPATRAVFLQQGAVGYIHYGICQAHQCDNTTLDVIFDPVAGRMSAKLLDRCKASWLGSPDAAEQALLSAGSATSHPAAASACGGGDAR